MLLVGSAGHRWGGWSGVLLHAEGVPRGVFGWRQRGGALCLGVTQFFSLFAVPIQWILEVADDKNGVGVSVAGVGFTSRPSAAEGTRKVGDQL